MRIRKGFTLIELLVVIAIIAILAAILFPVFMQAREKARQTSCLSNSRQIALGIQMYAQDYDEMIMPWLTTPGPTPQERIWVTRIQPYLKSGGGTQADGILRCPSWSESTLKLGSDKPTCNGAGAIDAAFPADMLFATYGIAQPMPVSRGSGTPSDPYFHHPGSGYAGRTAGSVYVGLPQILRPAETAIVTDGVTLMKIIGSAQFVSLFGCEGSEMHQKGCNVVFLDGHAKWVSGDPESYISQSSTGVYFRRFFSYDME